MVLNNILIIYLITSSNMRMETKHFKTNHIAKHDMKHSLAATMSRKTKFSLVNAFDVLK